MSAILSVSTSPRVLHNPAGTITEDVMDSACVLHKRSSNSLAGEDWQPSVQIKTMDLLAKYEVFAPQEFLPDSV